MRLKKSMRIIIQLAMVLLVCTAPSAQPVQAIDGMPLWAGPWGPHH